ncbi:MAG TPA: metalloregulator ArsR/SmtB family transcription factor [Cerasibacillus sp.]|uniref:helix-turn-helix transcriptional regulator n=1 Tax=Cerasibacillus sp. TaxID=2498711 RepID=UPI002F420749
MPSVKQKILDTLKKQKDVSIDDLMIHFTISEIAVRKHLQQLEAEGFLRKRTHKQKIGRPYHTYQLTKKGHNLYPNHYEQLPVELLDDLKELAGEEMVHALLEKRLDREKNELEQQLTTDDIDLEKRIKEIAQIQNKRGYMVELENKASGEYVMTYYHCPIANVACDYHEMCRHEKKMYEDLFPGSQVETPAMITRGDHYCKWVIKPPTKNK